MVRKRQMMPACSVSRSVNLDQNPATAQEFMGVIKSDIYRLLKNPALDRTSIYGSAGRNDILSYEAFLTAQREIGSWEGYSPTPLRELPRLAEALGVRQILFKDEGSRFGLGSFKALGGAYAVFRLLQKEIRARTGHDVSASDLVSGKLADVTSGITVTCATDGNHGRSVAWGARTFGCRCIIYVHAMVSNTRRQAIADYGAEIRIVQGNYDDSVRQASANAAEQGWHVVSDTSYEGYFEVPRDVMQGYSVMVDEALTQSVLKPTHAFVQGGVGGLAAAVCAHLWQRHGTERPTFVVVEPEKASCLYLSAAAGHPVAVHGALDTIMAGLACGEVSLQAWQILRPGADAFMTVSDEAAAETMRLLARPLPGDMPIVAGESAVAGLAAFAIAAASATARSALGIGPDSVILLFGTEGATDPVVYRQIVGLAAADIAAAAQA
jgi:diaminopropionate ammonia-lyase